jgi:hypothetical protein
MTRTPKAGDRVRVVLEGEVREESTIRPGSFFILHDGGHSWIPAEASVEVLRPPEPKWREGDVVVTGGDHVSVRRRRPDSRGSNWSCSCSERGEPDAYITACWRYGGATLLVRDGKPVQP